jgi:oligoribonuclease NrnB/cAMP/cGMP phosphodiesterase (DHH superfamily)
MITIYKDKKDIPNDKEMIILNDVYFNKVTVDKLDDKAEDIINRIDGATLVGKYRIKSKFNDVVLDIDKLSTGCKTVLNIIYNLDKVFYIAECGDNALDIIYSLQEGYVYCDFATISFEMDKVKTVSNGIEAEIDDYEELKEWWNSEE